MHLRIKEVMEERGIIKPKIKPLVQLGIPYEIAKDYINGSRTKIGLKHIELLCNFLRCTPNDLFEWKPGTLNLLDKDHPLQTIKKRSKFKVHDELQKLSPEEIRALFEKRQKEEARGSEA